MSSKRVIVLTIAVTPFCKKDRLVASATKHEDPKSQVNK